MLDVRNTIIQLDSTTFYSMTWSNSQNIFEPQRQFDNRDPTYYVDLLVVFDFVLESMYHMDKEET